MNCRVCYTHLINELSRVLYAQRNPQFQNRSLLLARVTTEFFSKTNFIHDFLSPIFSHSSHSSHPDPICTTTYGQHSSVIEIADVRNLHDDIIPIAASQLSHFISNLSHVERFLLHSVVFASISHNQSHRSSRDA